MRDPVLNVDDLDRQEDHQLVEGLVHEPAAIVTERELTSLAT